MGLQRRGHHLAAQQIGAAHAAGRDRRAARFPGAPARHANPAAARRRRSRLARRARRPARSRHLSTVFSAMPGALPLAQPRTRATVVGGWTSVLTLNTVDSHGNGVDPGPYRQSRSAMGGRAFDGRDRPPARPDQERRRRQSASSVARAKAVTSQGSAEAPHRRRFLRPELLMADRPSRREAFPFLRRPPARWQALLRRAGGHGLYPAEAVERPLTSAVSLPAALFRPARRNGVG